MRRRKRRFKHFARMYEQDKAQQQQDQQLDAEKSRLLEKQLWVWCIVHGRSEGDVKTELNRLYGGVLQVRMQNKHGAVVEFEEARVSESVLGARQWVSIFSGSNGRRSSREQLVLPAGNVGYLKPPCSCRRYRRPCTCPGYVKAERNRPTPNQSYHRGGAGEHTLQAVKLQIGSLDRDGQTLRPELESNDSCSVTVDLQQRCITVTAMLAGSTSYLLLNRFRHLRHTLALNKQERTVTFTVKQPPKILHSLDTCSSCGNALPTDSDGRPNYELRGDPTATKRFGMTSSATCSRCAARGVSGTTASSSSSSAALGVVGEGLAGADGLLGRCLTYRLTLQTYAMVELFREDNKLLKKLRSFKLLRSVQQQQQPGVPGTPRATGGRMAAPQELETMLQHLSFDVGYHVLVLLSAGVVSPWQVIASNFSSLLQRAAWENQDMTCKALAELSALATPVKELASVLQDQLEGVRQEFAVAQDRNPADRTAQFKVLRVHVTPTRVKFLLPEVQTGNRAVRHFCAPTAGSRTYSSRLCCLDGLQFSTGHFLRVSFGDAQGDKMFGDREECKPFYDRMRHVLKSGVVINRRKYEFLAFSASQLKTWSTWMVADPRQGSFSAAGAGAIADAMRHWLGDMMETERVPAKCAARLGQGFAATVDVAEVLPHQVTKIPDVECNVSPYCATKFSDGVGRISPELLEEVLEAMPYLSQDRPKTSAIQVRFQGCKGVLSRYAPLPGRQLQLRPSMEKFGSDHPQLEVCSVATCLPAYLNRQVIIMMNYNGVDTQVFLDKLKLLLDQLAKMCCSPEAALELLPSLGGVESGAQDTMLRLLDVAVSCGLSLDPLADSCLKAVARWQVTGLRHKARLLVPDAATLVGVMDEFGVLEEGEVFVQVQAPSRRLWTPSEPQIITGIVVLAKHPVAHRGDVRRVQAFDPRSSRRGGWQLVENYVNVVVFSQKGSRPLPNMLSGSDLDGDQYMVLWDAELLQPRNSEPMDYTAEPPEQLDRVEVQHLQEHFVDYARNDNLGQISNWLLAQADQNGADCQACEELAQLHSMAVDFPKTGRPAAISLEQRRNLVPNEYPTYMEKQDKESYESDTVLGQMYKRVMEHPLTAHLLEEDTGSSNNASSINSHNGNGLRSRLAYGQLMSNAADDYHSIQTWPQRLLHVPGIAPAFKGHVRQAEVRFTEFESEMVGLMNHWGVYDVGEMVTGCVPRFQPRQGQQDQHSDQRDQLNRELRGVFSRARSRFLQDLVLLSGSHSASDDLSMLTIRALEAMVDDEVESHLRNHNSCSFGDSIKLQYAAAYMVVAYKREILREHRQRQQQQRQQQHAVVASGISRGQHAAAVLEEDDESIVTSDDGREGESEVDESASEDDDDAVDGDWLAGGQQQQPEPGTRKEQEVKRLVRLCFQWVVAEELQKLARANEQQHNAH